MSTKVQEAVSLFDQGYNCSQAIVATYGPQFGIDREAALKVSCGFGGGMRMAETCGAVTGALMVLGLMHASSDSADKGAKQRTYELVTEFAERFRIRNGSVICKELLGCDLSTPEGFASAKEKNLFNSVCPKMVRSAGELLEEMEVP
ncbi:MAG: C_GCAxxG_C_C family protein [Phycisphaerales bacterium]|nr:MAG: C_GCAxxG_C_C family protein [Phycisphaerales bacterium]